MNLLELPAEIRVTVYSLLFIDRNGYALILPDKSFNHSLGVMVEEFARFHTRGSSYTYSPFHIRIDFLCTCRQVYEEAASLLYSQNLFKICVDARPHLIFEKSKPKLVKLPVSRIRSLELEVEFFHNDPRASSKNRDISGWVERRKKRGKQCEFFSQMSALQNLRIIMRDRYNRESTSFSDQTPGLVDCVTYMLEGIPLSVNMEWADESLCGAYDASGPFLSPNAEILQTLAKKHKDFHSMNRSLKTTKSSGRS